MVHSFQMSQLSSISWLFVLQSSVAKCGTALDMSMKGQDRLACRLFAAFILIMYRRGAAYIQLHGSRDFFTWTLTLAWKFISHASATELSNTDGTLMNSMEQSPPWRADSRLGSLPGTPSPESSPHTRINVRSLHLKFNDRPCIISK
jgi:hypothetical protein